MLHLTSIFIAAGCS